jgi:hypothetical protein
MVNPHRIALKAKYSFYSAVVFFLFINPETVSILHRALRGMMEVMGPTGFLTVEGVFLLTGLFFVTMLGLMLLPNE